MYSLRVNVQKLSLGKYLISTYCYRKGTLLVHKVYILVPRINKSVHFEKVLSQWQLLHFFFWEFKSITCERFVILSWIFSMDKLFWFTKWFVHKSEIWFSYGVHWFTNSVIRIWLCQISHTCTVNTNFCSFNVALWCLSDYCYLNTHRALPAFVGQRPISYIKRYSRSASKHLFI